MQSVLHRNPATAVPFLTSSLLGTDLPLGLKFLVLEWLMTSAKELSNIPTDATNPPMPLSLQAPVAAGVVGAVGESSTEDMIPGGARLDKTTIKRPAKLAQSKQRTKYFRNNFGPLSHLYFYPLMALLGKMWNNKLNEQTAAVAHSADKFNLISEMFEPQPPASGRNDKAHAGNQEKGKMLASHANLSHLDGVDALLPAQCLVALGVFTQCALNTVAQR